MESMIVKLLDTIANHGPSAVIALIFCILYLMEKRRTQQLSDKVYDLGIANVKAESDHTRVQESILKLIDSIDRRLS